MKNEANIFRLGFSSLLEIERAALISSLGTSQGPCPMSLIFNMNSSYCFSLTHGLKSRMKGLISLLLFIIYYLFIFTLGK